MTFLLWNKFSKHGSFNHVIYSNFSILRRTSQNSFINKFNPCNSSHSLSKHKQWHSRLKIKYFNLSFIIPNSHYFSIGSKVKFTSFIFQRRLLEDKLSWLKVPEWNLTFFRSKTNQIFLRMKRSSFDSISWDFERHKRLESFGLILIY